MVMLGAGGCEWVCVWVAEKGGLRGRREAGCG